MTDSAEAKATPEQSDVSIWRRLWLVLGNLGFFLVAAVLCVWLVPSFAGDEVSWWIKGLFILTFVIALTGVDLVLRAVLLRPTRRSQADATDRPSK